MSIHYCEISQDNRAIILVNHARLIGFDVDSILTDVQFDVNDFNTPKKTLLSGDYQIMCLLDGNLVWMCVADVNFSRRLVLRFLDEIRLSVSWEDPFAVSLIQTKMEHYNQRHGLLNTFEGIGTSSATGNRLKTPEITSQSPTLLKLHDTKSHLEDLRLQTQKAIEVLIKRGDKLNDLVNATEDLTVSASSFDSRARTVRRRMYCKNKWLCIGLISVGVIILIILICVLAWPKN